MPSCEARAVSSSSVRRAFGVLAVIAASAASTAAVAAPAPVTTTPRPAGHAPVPRPPPPFDTWCTSPACGGPEAARITSPIDRAREPRRGLLEAKLYAEAAKELAGLAASVGGLWSSLAARDALDAIAAAVSGDDAARARGSGLGAATVRVGLVLALDRALPASAGCVGSDRLDALYEALAVTPIAALDFRGARGSVTASCADAARTAGEAIARALLRAWAPDAKARADRLLSEADAAMTSCREIGAEGEAELAPLVSPGGAVRLEEMAARLERKPDAPSGSSPATTASEACAEAKARVVTAARALASLGFAASPVGDLHALVRDEGLAAPVFAEITALARSGTIDAPTLRAYAARAAEALAPSVSAGRLARASIEALGHAVASDGGPAAMDPNRIAEALSRDFALKDGKPTLRTLLGVGSSPWIVEVNGGVPRLATSDLRIVGDLALGYDSDGLGVVARGAVRYFDLTESARSTDSFDATSSFEAWLTGGDERAPVRLEGRVSAGTEYIDTTTLAAPAGAGPTRFGDYDSLLVRGSMLAGLRVRPSDRFLLHGLVGGGPQYETHDTTSVSETGVTLSSPDTWSAQCSLRVDARWKLVPQILSLRGHVTGAYFSVTREELSFASKAPGGGDLALTKAESTQLFAAGRLFVDTDVASFLGFVPAVFGGLDVTHVSAGGGDRTATVPVFGAGIVRPRI